MVGAGEKMVMAHPRDCRFWCTVRNRATPVESTKVSNPMSSTTSAAFFRVPLIEDRATRFRGTRRTTRSGGTAAK